MTRSVTLDPAHFRAELRADEGAAAPRTVSLVWSTGADVQRHDWQTGGRFIERLSLKPEHVDLSRLNAGAAILDSHATESLSRIVGAVEEGSARVDGRQGVCRARLSARADAVFDDIKARIIKFCSVGYVVKKFRDDGKDPKTGHPIRTAIDWMPAEISLVAIPADMHATVSARAAARRYTATIERAAVSDEDRRRWLRFQELR